MKSNESSFETILEAILKQKQVLDDLQAENETLRQQLADLRIGRGIFVEILGTCIPLAGAPDAQVVDVVSNGNAPIVDMIEDTAPVPTVSTSETDASLQETAAIPGEILQRAESETPLPGADFVIEDVSENEVPLPVRDSSTFLEEAMFAEFATASARRVSNWSGPSTDGPITDSPILDEKEKAALRRELTGSFLLE